MEVFDLDIAEIKPYPANAKVHPKKQIQALADSIKRFGITKPLVLDKDNNIISGHGTLLALQQLQNTKAPVSRLESLTEKEVKALRIADNKIAEMGEWEFDALRADLLELDEELFNLTGFDGDILLSKDEKDDQAPATPVTPSTQLGDLYALGDHRLLCGDATSTEDMQRLMQGNKADLIFTDPPYNVDYTGKTKDALKLEGDKQSADDFLGFLVKAFNRMAEHSKKGAAVYVCHADLEGLNFRLAFRAAGFSHKQSIIWNKNNMTFSRQDYHWKHEPILYGWQEGEAHVFYGGRTQTTVWDIDRPSRSEEHPTMKPVELVMKAIVNSSKGGDIILDPFAGAGSTIIAAEKGGRVCYASEIDPKYCDVIIQRWSVYTGRSAEKI